MYTLSPSPRIGAPAGYTVLEYNQIPVTAFPDHEHAHRTMEHANKRNSSRPVRTLEQAQALADWSAYRTWTSKEPTPVALRADAIHREFPIHAPEDRVIIDSERLIHARTEHGAVVVVRSVLVRDDDPEMFPVSAEVHRRGLILVSETTLDNSGYLFGTVRVSVYQHP